MAEAHHDRDILRGYELRLLRCTLSPPPPAQPETPAPPASASENDNNNLHARIEQLLGLIESGKYLQVISSDVAAELLVDCSQLVDRVEFFVGANGVDVGEEERACRVIIVLCVAVAALFFFTQCNITGPLDELPNCPLPFKVSEGEADLEAWACNQLIADGSDLLAKFSYVQYIVFAKMLVMRTKDLLFEGSISPVRRIRSVSWWLARILHIEQRILDELSSSLLDLLRVCMAESLHHFGNLEQVAGYWGAMLHDEEASAIVSMVHLEAGIMDYTYAHVDSCRLHFESAEAAAGLELSVTGVLGYRTMHQVEPRAQRVLVTNNSSSSNTYSGSSISPTLQTSGSSVAEDNLQQHQHQISGDSDIFMRPILLKNGSEYGLRSETSQNGAPDGVAPLKAIQQAVILAKCLLLEKSSRHDELQRWDMAPFIEAIDSQPSSFFALRCFCNLLRIRWESTRSHTKERAVEMMNKLVEGAQKPFPGVTERIPFCYVAHVPTIPALQKEYSELLVSCGLIGEALRIFEGLELWDNVIYCNRLLGKKAAAVELIKKRLSEVPNDPKLWCSLGDVTNDDSCYKKALEVSNDKSIRAKRSLARSAYNKGDYETSKVLWESAMALNSLYPDGWFALGAAALKARDIEKALYAFTNAVQLDPENGEAWNNIACLHMIKKRSQEAFISFKEALKLKRDSWQMWENFGSVAMDVGNMHQALEAVQMVLNLTSGKRVDAELLERIMVEIEQRASSCLGDSCNDSEGNFEIRPELSRETEQLVELLGKILQQIVKSESRADIWGLYGRWHKVKGDLIMCSEAFLKLVRLYQGSNLWKDRERFKKFAKASVELCKVYMEISSSTGSSRELFTAEMHLKNIVKQGDGFSDTQEFRDIQACLDEVRLRLQSKSVPT